VGEQEEVHAGGGDGEDGFVFAQERKRGGFGERGLREESVDGAIAKTASSIA
jgi:hypothetical protein